MTSETLLALALLLPLVTAVLVLLTGRRENLRESMSLLGACSLFVVTTALLFAVADGESPTLLLAEPLPFVSVKLLIEPLGALFACFASFLWIVTTIYSIGYMRGHGEQNQTRFYAFFALALHAVIGAAYSGNLLTVFIFYELLTLSTYPLVTHAGTDKARTGGRVYLGILLSTSIGLLLPAILVTQQIAGTGDFTEGGFLQGPLAAGTLSSGTATLLFALFAFGIGKAALMPFHRWLPAAMVAPTPVSALLHAVAVVKTGVFVLLKVVLYVFGIDTLHQIGAAVPIAYVAGFTMLAASIVALYRDNLKERLAWSTIGQLSYIVAGACSATSAGAVGAGLHMVTHAFGKITLFFAAGAIMVAAHVTTVRGTVGLGRRMPVTFVAFAIAAGSIIGLPPMGGVWSKWWLGLGLHAADRPLLLYLLLFSSLLSVAYLAPIVIRAFLLPQTAAPGSDPHHPTGDAPWPCRLALLITASGCICLFFLIDPLRRLLTPLVP